MSDDLSIPADWRPAPPVLESVDPSELPELPPVGTRVLTEEEQRARRIFATCRWAGVIAITEMASGFDAAMAVVATGPADFLPDEEDFAKINETGQVAIRYIETGSTS